MNRWMIATILLLVLFVGGWQRSRPAWEYKIVSVATKTGEQRYEVEKILSDQGAQGWELIQFRPNVVGGFTILPQYDGEYYFKRPK